MNYISVCSGIEAATVAWHHLGWNPVAFSEIEKFPSAVLRHHYPHVRNLGDMTKYHEWPDFNIDLLVGGTPCQAFSVAGLREGLKDPRGNLTLTFLGVAAKYRPKWIVWENVPGVLSDKTNAFGSLLAGLAELGYGWAYRILDAQYAGVPQRRRRVFVVGCIGDWASAAAVLFEPDCLRWNPPPSRKTGQEVAGTLSSRTSAGGGLGTDFDLGGGLRAGVRVADICPAVTSKWAKGSGGPAGDECQNLVAFDGPTHSLRAEGFDASEDGTGRGTPLVPVAIQAGALRTNPDSGPDGVGVSTEGVAYTLEARAEVQAVAFSCKDSGQDAGDISPTLRSMGHAGSHQNGGGQVAVAFNWNAQAQQLNFDPHTTPSLTCSQGAAIGPTINMSVRRLTPKECERLQGFPDNYTDIPYRNKPAADGPRYKALGNSMAVPVMRWIGERIAAVDAPIFP